MNIPSKIFFSAVAIFASTASYTLAQNTEQIHSFVGGAYMGSESINQVSGSVISELYGKGGLSGIISYSDFETDYALERTYDGSYEVFSGTLGYTYASDSFSAGLYLSAVTAELDAGGFISNLDSVVTDGDGMLISIGIAKSWNKFRAAILAGAGELSYDTQRESILGVKDSDYDVSLYYFSLNAMYDLYVTEKYALTPFLELGYQSMETDDIEEPLGFDRASIDSFENEIPYAELGIRFDYLAFERFKPFASLSYWSNLGDDTTELDGTVGGFFNFNVETEYAIQQAVISEFGFGLALSDTFDLGVSAGFFSASDAEGFNVGLSGSFLF